MSKPLRVGLAILLILLLALPAAVGLLLALAGSEAGTAFLARQLQGRFEDTVSWEKMEGSLLGSLHLEQVKIQQPGLQAEISTLSLDWQPGALLQGRLEVTGLAADNIRIGLSATDAPASSDPFSPGSLQLPLDVALRDISLSNLQLVQDDQPPWQIDALTLSASLEHNRLELQQLDIRLPQGGISLRGSASLHDHMPVDLQAGWNWLLSPQEAGATATTDVARVPLNGEASLSGAIDWGQAIDFDIDYRVRGSGLSALDAELPPTITASGKLLGRQAAEELELRRGSLSLEEAPLQLSAQARIRGLNSAAPEVVADLAWRELQWPLVADESLINSTSGTLTLSGTSEAYDVKMAAALAGKDIPPGDWALEGSGDPGQIHLQELQGQVLGGQVMLRGPIQWQPGISWQLQLKATGLDPSALSAELSGKLSLDAQSSGSLHPDSGLLADITVRQLSGQLMDYPLQVEALARVTGEQLLVQHLQLESGGNRLSASGNASAESLALDWDLDAPAPGTILEGASGLLIASGSVQGNPQSPVLQLRLQGSGLHLDTLSIPSLEVAARAGLAAQDTLELQLDSGPIREGETAMLQSLQLRSTGTTARHHITLTANTVTEQLKVRLAGGIGEALTTWQGEMAELTVNSEDYGNWYLGEPAALALSADEISLADSCLREAGSAGKLCARGNWASAGDVALTAKLDRLPLQLLLDEVNGEASAELEGKLAADGVLRATGILQLNPGEVQIALDNRTRLMPYQGGKITLTVDDRGLLARADLRAPEQGRVAADVALPAFTHLPLPGQQPIRGHLQATLPDLGGIAAWIPELASSSGSLDADLAFAGSLEKPRVTGELALRDGTASIPMAGLELKQIDLHAASDPGTPGQLHITGGMLSGGGQLELSGLANLDDSSVALQLSGERFQLYNTSDARVFLSPDLAVAWRDETLSLRGQVTVPEAAITPKLELSPAMSSTDVADSQATGQIIAPSPDVVVINSTLETPEDTLPDEAPFAIDSELKLVMGDDVRVNAVGFISQITGAVTFTNTPQQTDLIPLAFGLFELQGGTFRSFGQDLEIETGQIIFPNVPATQPELNLRAVRWIDNDPQVTAAGITVTGPLEQPVLELFSRPQLETSEIQSYLLTGRSARSRDSVLSIGTYVSPRIYVGYGYNLLDETSEFNSLFTINPRYGVSGNFGEADNNINVTFTYER